ncbi:hypothetical protein IFM89_028070 [Coptis chinensis]|uniref:Uncharacterized protein n=1 Tax=Coptis chinensis TaxID=261450 RepID=A0A835LK32_9MAGN|nr:hypothetical protein IFM89_028070 [Coptis chinensis]
MQQQPHSPWHSSIPYLFGGLAAIYVGSHNEERDLEKAQDSIKTCPVFEEKIVVIMAGNDNHTYLATPVFTNNVSSFHQDNETISNEKEVVVSEKNEDEKDPNRTLMNNIKVWKKLGKPKPKHQGVVVVSSNFCLLPN